MLKTKALFCLMLLVLGASFSFAQTPVVNTGWEVFVIREGATMAPFIVDNDDYVIDSIEVGTTQGGQKVGLATDLINGAKISQIASLHIDRLDDVAASGSMYGPYFNIWVTDGLGNYAVIANEPSNAEWGGDPWDVANWADLQTKSCKVYETPGWNTDTSWVHAITGPGPLTFNDVANLIIAPPSIAYIQDPANGVGSGAPDVLGTDVAYGYTWVFGDTSSNYVSGGDGFIVNGYSATAVFSVQNITQGTSYSTIEAALAGANPADVITVDDGTYSPPSTLTFNQSVTLTGASEAGVIINVPPAGYGFSITASNVLVENFTLLPTVANVSFPIHASGTSDLVNGLDYLTIRNATISGTHHRTGFDIHGYNHVVLSHLTSSDATGGNGVQVTGCIDVDMDNITTFNNLWGSIAIYSSSFMTRGSDDIVIDGNTMNLAEQNLYNQNEFGLVNTNISIPGYEYLVRNMNYRGDAAGFTHYQDTFAEASAFALGLETIAVGSYILTIADGNATVIPGLTIQPAVDGIDPLRTVNILAGSYVAPAQIVIDKDLTLAGAGAASTTILPGFNTTVGYYLVSDALVYVDNGVTAIIKDLAIDGTGFTVRHGVQSRGTELTVQDCEIRNIYANIYAGRGIVFLSGLGSVNNCTMTNIQRIGIHIRGGVEPTVPVVAVDGFNYTGKGAGDYLDYGIEFGGGGKGTVANSTITACEGVATVDNSDSAAILVSDYYGTFTEADITNSTLTGNSTGVVVGYDISDISDVSIHGTDLSGNATAGVSSTGVSVDAIGNWWGHATGPLDNSDDTGTGGLYNPLGLGVPVTDNVLYNPWTGLAAVEINPVVSGPLTCGQNTTLTFKLTMDASTPDVFGFNAIVRATSEVSWLPLGAGITSANPFGATTQFLTSDNGDGSYTISGTTQGNPTQPISGAGVYTLFSVVFLTANDGVADITFDSFTLRDPANQPVAASVSGATIVVDCIAPAAVTNITAAPHHNKVEVTWNHDGLDVDHYEIYRGLWYDTTIGVSAYPEYDDLAGDVIPTREANRTATIGNLEWVLAGTTPGGTLTFNDVWGDHTNRGVYYYEVFAVDNPLPAGNNAPAAAANDRATNYWLGDMDFTGAVAVYDMSVLGTAFGTSDPGAGYNAAADVGPTDDYSRVGIPTTDNGINFEDLMVFSMNFGVVTSSNKTEAPISTTADLSWVRFDEGSFGLRLNNATGLKGIHLRAALPEGAQVSVSAGDLLDQQSEMTFLRNIGESLDVNLAVMGVDNGFTGTGNLFLVESSVELTLDDLVIELRGSDNSTIEATLDTESGVLTPRVFSLNAAYPNPFNPMTKISFSLPESQLVRLNVYGIDGKLVASLVDETRGAGLHEIIWNGQNDSGQVQASGLYFYRIEAGPYSQVRKMTLMK